MQALTLSTGLTGNERLKGKLDAGNTSRDEDQSFTSRTMRHIKVAHQLSPSPGMSGGGTSCRS